MNSNNLGEYYADFDENTNLYCVFHTETGDRAYSAWSSMEQAVTEANSKNAPQFVDLFLTHATLEQMEAAASKLPFPANDDFRLQWHVRHNSDFQRFIFEQVKKLS